MKIESFFKIRDAMQCNAIMFLVYIVRSIDLMTMLYLKLV